jgi:hypothetical protein
MLVALDGRPEWLAFAAGGYYAAEPGLGARFAIPSRLQDAVAYGVPLVVVGVGALIRNELAKRAALAPVRVAAEPAVAEPVNAEPVPSAPAVAEPVVAEPVPGELEVPV